MKIRILLQKMFHPIVGYKTIFNASIHYNKKVICFYCMYYVRIKVVSIYKVGITMLCPMMIKARLAVFLRKETRNNFDSNVLPSL